MRGGAQEDEQNDSRLVLSPPVQLLNSDLSNERIHLRQDSDREPDLGTKFRGRLSQASNSESQSC